MKEQVARFTIPAQQVVWIAEDNIGEFWIKIFSVIPPSAVPGLTGWLDGNGNALPSSTGPSPMNISIVGVNDYVNEFERTLEVDGSGDYTISDQYNNQWCRLLSYWFRTP